MKLVATIILGMCLASRLWATDPTTTAYDQELTQITTDLSKRLEGTSIKTIAAVDFKDLQGKPTNLGKFLSEEISTSMAMQDRNISMADRANLKRIMDEYKLTEDGLVNPENAKKLGQLAGLDAIMFGTVIPFGNGYRVDVKVIATDTGKFAAAARGTFAKSDSLDSLAEVKDGIVSTANTETPQDADAPPPPPKQKKYNLGGASVEIKSVEYFKSQKKVRVFYSVTLTPAPYSYYYSTSAFAYHTND
jgi:TolB-like protein